jgi:hypothetical protein
MTLSPAVAEEVIPAFAVTPGMEAECSVVGDTFAFSWQPPVALDGVFLERYSYNTTDAEIVYRKTYEESDPAILDGFTIDLTDLARSYIYSLCLTYPDPVSGGDSIYLLFDFTGNAYRIPEGTPTGTITLSNITDAAHYYFNLDDRYFGLVYAGGQDVNELEIIYPAGDYRLQVSGDERNPYDRYEQFNTEGHLAAGDDEFISLDSNLFIE